MRDPKTFTDNMKLAVQVLYESGQEMTPTEIGQRMSPRLSGQQLTGPLRALRVGGWAKRRKVIGEELHVGYRTYPVIRRNYLLTNEGRRAWADYLTESRMNRRATVTCDHTWLDHWSSENSFSQPDGRLCTACGKTELFVRPTRFPDLHDQLTDQTRRALETVERAPWRERAWSMFQRGCRNLIDFILFRV